MSRKAFVTGAVFFIGAGAMVGADTVNKAKNLGLQTDQAHIFVSGMAATSSATTSAALTLTADFDSL